MKYLFIILLSCISMPYLFAQNADLEAFKSKLTTTSQKNTYEKFLKTINDQRWASPTNQSAIYYKSQLEDDKLDEQTAKSFKKLWISTFQDHAQSLVNQFVNNRVIATDTEFADGALLMQECLNALSSSDKEFKIIKVKRLFLDAFSTYQKQFEGRLRGTATEKKALFAALIPNLEEAAKLSSEPYLQRAIGLFYQEIGDATKAEAAFQKAIAQNNDFANTIVLGDFYLNQENYEKAMLAFKNANKIQNGQLPVLERISNTLVLQGKPDTALTVINNYLFGVPVMQSKQFTIAYDYFKNKLKEKQSGFYYYALGYLFENGLGKNKNIEEAQKWYEYAQALNLLAAGERLYFCYNTGLLFAKDVPYELNRIRQNALQRARPMEIPCVGANGIEQVASVYVQDFPKDPNNPIAQESKRLEEVFGLAIQPVIISTFNQLFQIAQKSNRSFQEVCLSGLDIPASKPPVVASNTPTNTTAVVSASNGIQNVATNNFETQAMQAIDNKRFDEVIGLMANAITQSFNLNLQDVNGSTQQLIALLPNAGNKEGLIYYALGYLNEPSDRGKAVKWYNYAFQIGYKPAFYKLTALYKTVSDSKIRWLRDNYNKGFSKLSVPCKRLDGSPSGTVIYLMEYPWDINNPLGAEADRVKDAYQSVIEPTLLTSLGQVYQLALANNTSFVGLVNTAITLIQQNKTAQKDVEFKAVQALSGVLK